MSTVEYGCQITFIEVVRWCAPKPHRMCRAPFRVTLYNFIGRSCSSQYSKLGALSFYRAVIFVGRLVWIFMLIFLGREKRSALSFYGTWLYCSCKVDFVVKRSTRIHNLPSLNEPTKNTYTFKQDMKFIFFRITRLYMFEFEPITFLLKTFC